MPNSPDWFDHWNNVRQVLERTKARFLLADSDLLRLSAHEVSVTAKFACYVQCSVNQLVENVNVDCEYTRVGRAPHHPPKQIGRLANKGRGPQRRRPDIIIHKRGDPNANFVVIEAKWRGEDDRRARETLAFLASAAQLERAREHPDFVAVGPYRHAVLMTVCRDRIDIDFERLGEDEIACIVRETRR